MAKGEPFPRSPAGTECSGSAAERGRERRPLNVGPRGRRAAAGSRGGFSSARRLGRGDLRGLRKDEERGPSAFPHPAGLGGRGAGAAARPSPCPAELPSRRPPLGGFAITSDSSLRRFQMHARFPLNARSRDHYRWSPKVSMAVVVH